MTTYRDWTPARLAAQFALRQIEPQQGTFSACAVGMIMLHHELPIVLRSYLELVDRGYPAGWLDNLIAAFDGRPRVCLPDSLELEGAELGLATWRLLAPLRTGRTPLPAAVSAWAPEPQVVAA